VLRFVLLLTDVAVIAMKVGRAKSMDKTNNSPGTGTVAGSTQTQKDVEYSTTVRERIAPPTSAGAGTGVRSTNSQIEMDEMERLRRRYAREAQLAVEGALYWALRWPFELMANLVSAGRKWEEEYYRSAPKRRVSLYDDEV